MKLSREDADRIIFSLRLIFWGELFSIIHLGINSFDILNEFTGSIMITVGIFMISKINVNKNYSLAMNYLKISSILLCITSLFYNSNTTSPLVLPPISVLLNMVTIITLPLFALSMQWLCKQYHFSDDLQRWKRSMQLLIVTFAIPVTSLQCIALLNFYINDTRTIDIGVVGGILLLLSAVSIIYFLFTISKFKTGLEKKLKYHDL